MSHVKKIYKNCLVISKTSDKHHHQTEQDVELKAERCFKIVLYLLTLLLRWINKNDLLNIMVMDTTNML